MVKVFQRVLTFQENKQGEMSEDKVQRNCFDLKLSLKHCPILLITVHCPILLITVHCPILLITVHSKGALFKFRNGLFDTRM